jgi:hypothetical protein
MLARVMAGRTASTDRPCRSVRFITKALIIFGIRFERTPLRVRLSHPESNRKATIDENGGRVRMAPDGPRKII